MSSDSHLRIFDLRTPPSAYDHLTLSIPIHAPIHVPSEALTHDWNKYREHVIATAGVDKLIRTFDLRAGPSRGPVDILPGHDYAVRRLAWSPHASDLLLSASYDMTCRVWNIPGDHTLQQGGGAFGPAPPSSRGNELGRMLTHTEFVTGLDWCLFGSDGWCATCAWDERVLVWDVRTIMAPIPPPP